METMEKEEEMGRFTYWAYALGVVTWIGASLAHCIESGRPFHIVPDSLIDAVIRVLIFAGFVVAGLYLDHFASQVRKLEREKQALFHETVHASQHVLNNFLNQSAIVRIEAEKFPDFSNQVMGTFNRSIQGAAQQLKELDKLSPQREGEVMACVYPRANNDQERAPEL